MSRDGSTEQDFAGERRLFRLAWDDLVALQESRDAGPFVILNRLIAGTWRLEDIAETIRCGLIGSGMEAPKARSLVINHVEKKPPMMHLVLAQTVLGAGVYGAADEENVGKKSVADETTGETPHSPTESSASPPSTETGP